MRILSDLSLKNWKNSDKVLMLYKKKMTCLRDNSVMDLKIKITFLIKSKMTFQAAKWKKMCLEMTVILVNFKLNTSIKKSIICLKLMDKLPEKTYTLVLKLWVAGKLKKVSNVIITLIVEGLM